MARPTRCAAKHADTEEEEVLVDLTRSVLETTTASCAIGPLYVRSPYFSGLSSDRGQITIGAHGYADFMTYFGSFSLNKWRQYTGRADLTPMLCFESSEPVDVTLTQMQYHRVEKRAIAHVEKEPSERADDGWLRYEIAYPNGLDAEVVAFTALAGDKPTTIRNVRYAADLPEGRDVRIEIITTTFRKEAQVTGNINALRTTLLDDPEWAPHFRLTVVDNGRTLDPSVTGNDPAVTLIPNGNVGGAGGFAAGMLHALDEGWATHVLMMDDDVTVCPESYKRTVQLLAHASGEYEQAIVAGAMLSNANFELQQEDLGVIQPGRYLNPLKPRLLLDREYDITLNEQLQPATGQQGVYSAWWYSCVPVSTVRRTGLPIPLFYRRDDVEYATRIQERETLRFMTLNGVCVWHDTFDLRWNPAVEVYLSVRNLLIQQAFTPDPMNSTEALIGYLNGLFDNHARRLDYRSMEQMCDGIDDYFKGPDHYRHPVGEAMLQHELRKNEPLTPLKELDGAPDHVNLRVLEDSANDTNVPPDPAAPTPSFARRVTNKLLRIAGRAPLPATTSPRAWDDSLGIIPVDGNCTPWRVMHNRRRVLAVNPAGTKGAIRTYDARREASLRSRFHAQIARLRQDKALPARYHQARASMTSVEFWREYLAEAMRGE